MIIIQVLRDHMHMIEEDFWKSLCFDGQYNIETHGWPFDAKI